MVAKKQLTKFLGGFLIILPAQYVELVSELINSKDHEATV